MKNHSLSFLTPIRALLVLCLLTINTSMAEDALAIDTHIDQLKQLIEDQIITNNQGVGAVIGIIEKGHMRSLIIGKASNNHNKPMDNNSLFEIGSISKTFTAVALADMVIEGIVKLDDPIQKYLPKGVKVPQKGDQPITLLSLATHDSGLPRLPSNLDLSNLIDPYRAYNPQALYDFLNAHQLARAVGEQREYSNLGFGLLGHILSLIDSKPYEQVIQDRVLMPLKIHQTYQLVPIKETFVDGHNHSLDQAAHWNFDALAGAGALKSNLSDMLTYLKANMKATNKAIQLSHQAQTDFGTPDQDIGLAWITTKSQPIHYTWHNGGTAGFRTFIGFNKTLQKGIVVMANSSHSMDNIAQSYLTDSLTSLIEDSNKPALQLDTDQLNQLTGIYALSPAFKLTVTHKQGSLFVQATGQENFEVYATSPIDFYYKVVQATLKFNADEHGITTSVTLSQNGQQLTGMKEH